MDIRPYRAEDHDAVVRLWSTVFGYAEPRNRPAKVLADKLSLGDGLLFVALEHNQLVGTLMGGYDGHRGWFYRVAVAEHVRGTGIGRALVQTGEAALRARGCAKINILTHAGNDPAIAFWQRLGYVAEPRVSLGKDMG